MAKTARLKKASKSTSLHSRSAKRASSPSINLDKSLTSIKAPAESLDHRPSILLIHKGAGVTKRKAKGKPLSRQQKRRHEKGVGRAEAVLDKTERKVQRSAVREKVVKERGVAWEEVNGKAALGTRKNQGKIGDKIEWEDESQSEETSTDGNERAAAMPIQSLGILAAAEALNVDEDEDEIS
ncbi:hypothetical protein MMC12_000942 [Toensbergia leucococca]|nr:hypothetical protein [Toensbergia leucococca]